METLKVELDWSEPKRKPEVFPESAGVYMVIAVDDSGPKWDPDSYILLDIGETGGVKGRLSNHRRKPDWEARLSQLKQPRDYAIIYKFAPMPVKEYPEEKYRVAVEWCLRVHWIREYGPSSLCGDEGKNGYTKEQSVTVTNTGHPAPLSKGPFICKGIK